MKINGNEIRIGNVIRHQDTLWRAVKCDHVKPGKGGAFNQCELKNLFDGRKLNERFRASETVERVRLEQRDFQYLYENDGMLVFMDQETYDQVELTREFVGETAVYLQEGMIVQLESHEGTYISAALPEHVTLEVTGTEPTVKGQTASSSYKPATTENGLRVMVPPHLSVNTRIVVSTETGEYVRRAD